MEKQHETEILGQEARKAKDTPCLHAQETCSAHEQGTRDRDINGAALSLVGQKKVRILPAALFTGHRPFWVVLTVTEVRHEVVKPDNSTAAKYSVVAGNLQL